MRTQLILQKIEDTLPITDYLTIDDARRTYLVKPVATLLSNDPNIGLSLRIGDSVIAHYAGTDFKELKQLELLSELENGISLEKRSQLAGLEKELAIQFERRMLKLSREVRERELQNYTNFSFGNPLLEIQSFDRMKDFMSDREMILGMNS